MALRVFAAVPDPSARSLVSDPIRFPLLHFPHPTLWGCSLDQYTEEQKTGLVDSCPTKVFSMDENSGAVVIANAPACIFCKECIYTLEDYRKAPEDKLAVEIKHSPDRFTFAVETNGALWAKEVVKAAFQVLEEKLTRLKKAIPALQTDL